MKTLTSSIISMFLLAVFIGPAVFTALGFRHWWSGERRLRSVRSICGIAALILSTAAIMIMWGAAYHEYFYGFEFNYPEGRISFLRAGSQLAALGMVLAFGAFRKVRATALIATIAQQLFWIMQSNAV